MLNLHTSELDEFIAICDKMGGIGEAIKDPNIQNITLAYNTKIDLSLDPFCEAYYLQQIELYKEISGRNLNQGSGEMYNINVDMHVAGANPYAERNISFIARHTASIMYALMLAGVKPGAKALDLGCGWGLTSELMAYCGADVCAVDINPLFIELVKKRAAKSGLPIQAEVGNFDLYETNEKYDIILFYECLHHATRPWITLKRVAEWLSTEGKILWAGEPVNEIWWPNWGLRLDAESLYVMKKFGWFENGWSANFINSCMAKAGLVSIMHKSPINGGFIGNGIIKI
jgi:2-polyprenyl-3-methyl-5-hydroxy-6-metoxy-1,4-benzoquinol methylase